MNGFISSIKKLLHKIKNLPEKYETCQYSSGTIHEAMANANLNGLVAEYKDLLIHINRFKSDFSYYRITVRINTHDNAKVKNIELILDLIKSFETNFIYMDKIRVYPYSGGIYLDIYRLDCDI